MKTFTTHGVRSVKFSEGVDPGLVMLAYNDNNEYIVQMEAVERDQLRTQPVKISNSGASAKYGLKANGI